MKLIRNCLLVALLASSAGLTVAEDEVHPFISDKFSIQLGAFLPSKDFKLSVDGTAVRANQEFDWESATGFGKDAAQIAALGRFEDLAPDLPPGPLEPTSGQCFRLPSASSQMRPAP